MKKIFTTTAMIVLTYWANAQYKPITPSVSIEEVKAMQLKITVENPSHQQLYISLQDDMEDDSVWFTEYATTDTKYTQTLDVSNLREGEYKLYVCTNKGCITKSFELSKKADKVLIIR